MSRKSREALKNSGRIPWHVLALAALLALITFIAFAPAFGNRFIAFDDANNIVENPYLNPLDWTKFKRFWTGVLPDLYTPVMWSVWGVVSLSARVELPNGGAKWDPAPLHALNLFAHAAAAGFALLVLRRLVKSDRAAFVGAALFALHPIQTEAVAWAAAMKTPLSGMFSLWALWQYLKFSDRSRWEPQARRRWRNYAFATTMFVLALMTKATVVVLPAIIVLMEMLMRGRKLREVLPPILPWFAVAVFFGWVNMSGQLADDVLHPSLGERLILSANSIGFYLFKIVAPFPLLPDYSRTPAAVLSGGGALWIVCVPTVILLGTALAFWRSAAWITVSAAIFVLGVVTTVGIIPYDYQVYTTVADRYAYLSMFGPAMALAFLMSRNAPPLKRRRLTILATCLLVACGALSLIQSRRWHDSQTLFQFTLRHNGASLAAYRSLASDAFENRRYVEALDVANKGLAVRPGDVTLLHFIGSIAMAQRRYDDAIAAFRESAVRGPNREERLNNLGSSLAFSGRLDEAEVAFKQSLEVNKDFAPAAQNLRILQIQRLRMTTQPTTAPVVGK